MRKREEDDQSIIFPYPLTRTHIHIRFTYTSRRPQLRVGRLGRQPRPRGQRPVFLPVAKYGGRWDHLCGGLPDGVACT